MRYSWSDNFVQYDQMEFSSNNNKSISVPKASDVTIDDSEYIYHALFGHDTQKYGSKKYRVQWKSYRDH